MAYRSSTLLAGGSGTSMTINVPAGAAINDIAVVGVYKESTATITGIASGFTSKALLNTSATARGSLQVFWKRLTAADTGTYAFSWSGSAFKSGACALFSGRITSGDPFTTFGTAENTSTGSSLNVTTSGAAGAGDDSIDMHTDFTGGNNWNTPPTGHTTRVNNDTIGLFTQDNVSGGVIGPVSPVANVSGFMKAFLGTLAPASGAVILPPVRKLILPQAVGRAANW